MASILPFVVVLFILFTFPSTITSQDFSSSNPTIADCTQYLVPLTPCAPFAQGMVLSPMQSCCDNLQQLYNLQPGCLCLLLNNTTLSTFPINTTLALELPLLCNLQANVSNCLGSEVPMAPAPPQSQVSHGANSSSSHVVASPLAPVAPRPSIGGLGLMSSSGLTLNPFGSLEVAVETCAFLLVMASGNMDNIISSFVTTYHSLI